MRAWLWDGSKGLDHLRLTEAPDPIAKDDEVVLEIRHAALNPADRYLAEQRYPYPVYPPLPHVLGRDGMGTVIQVGDGVRDLRVGDRRAILRSSVGVFRWGTFAERVSVPAVNLVEIPAGWSEEESAGAALVYMAAYRALTMWEPLRPGAVVLVTGASGGVGVASVQVATKTDQPDLALYQAAEKGSIGSGTFWAAPSPRLGRPRPRHCRPNRRSISATNSAGPSGAPA